MDGEYEKFFSTLRNELQIVPRLSTREKTFALAVARKHNCYVQVSEILPLRIATKKRITAMNASNVPVNIPVIGFPHSINDIEQNTECA